MSIDQPLLPWLINAWQQLNEYRKLERIPQALLISGARGLGKLQLAEQFAYSVLCEQPTQAGLHCGQCHACLLMSAKSHPDFIEIVPDDDKKSISINQIRAVISDSYLKPQFEYYRVIIINPADVLTMSAANAFLKCLEEPTERTVFILVTDKPSKLPATIASRCQKIVLAVPKPELVKQWLTDNGVVNQDKNALENLLKGSLLTPKQLMDAVILKQREECFNDWLAIARQNTFPVLVAEKWDKLPKIELLDWLISWVADTIKSVFNVNLNYFYNQDFIKPLQKDSQQLDLFHLYRLYDLLLNCRQQIGMQLNFQVMLEEILVCWQELNRRTLHG